MALRRGFKKEANDLAIEFRKELDIAPHLPLCPWVLADHLEIPILPISKLGTLDSHIMQYFQGKNCQLSAAAIRVPESGKCIIFNDHHTDARQASSVAHEIAHIVLMHDATQIIHDNGTRKFDSVIEEEASNFGAILQIPDVAARHIVDNALPANRVCKDYKVSAAMLNWRLRMSGAHAIKMRRAQKG